MKGVLFDAEDVLYYRDAETLKPIISLLSKHSYSVSAEQFKDAYEKDKLSLYKGMISKDEHLKKTLEHLHIRPDDAFFHTFRDVFRSAYSEIKVAMGIKQLFKKLQLRGIKIGILTDTFPSEKKKWEWFNKIGLDGHIAAIICSSESGFTKDQKEAYDLGAKKLGLGINDVIFVGHQRYEMLGARKAGMMSVSIVKGVGEDVYLNNLHDLMPDFLNSPLSLCR